ncbi:MAG: fliG [Pedosphaera sp.]|nr:fliG [Pedosphaera sp.]
MNATKEAEPKTASEGAELTRIQKLAGLLLMINEENAAQIMKGLDEHELEAVSAEMAKFATISQEMQAEILRDFSPVAVEAVTAISGGVGRVERLLEKSVGLFRTTEILGRVSPQGAPVAAMQQIVEMEPRHIFNILRHEQIQTIALVASYLPQEKAAELLSLFRPEQREQIIERLATLAPTSIEVVESVAEELQRKFGGNRRRAVNQTGGVKVAAQLLNALPKSVSKSILSSLHERNADLAKNIGKKMFTFEELERLEPRTLQVILQAVDMHTLAVALKAASPAVKAALLGSISKRAAQNVREEIDFMGSLKPSEIDTAQSSIIDIVRQLEGEGEIDLENLRQPQARF